MSENLKAHVFLLMANLIYAANFTIAKEVMPDYIKPFGFIVFRVSISLILFWIVHRLFIKEKVARRDFPLLILSGIFGVTINQLLFFKGLNWSTPINASLIMTTTPVLVLMASALILRERITLRKIIGIALGASGAITLILYGQSLVRSTEGSLGDLLIFINACSYGIYLVIVKKLMDKYNPVTVVKWVYIIGLIGVLPFGYREAMAVSWTEFTLAIWAAFAFVVVLATFLAFLFNAWAIKILSPTIVGIYIYSQPFLASLIALNFAKDVLSWPKIFAGLLIFIGVYLVSSRLRSPEKIEISDRSNS